MENKNMPDVLYINKPIEEHNGDLLYEGRVSRFNARHKYANTDKLAKVRESLVKMADMWSVEKIHKKGKYQDCDFEKGYDLMVKRARKTLAILDELGV
jgi:hypothetical protein